MIGEKFRRGLCASAFAFPCPPGVLGHTCEVATLGGLLLEMVMVSKPTSTKHVREVGTNFSLKAGDSNKLVTIWRQRVFLISP